jgi:hypothetical protein
MAATAPKESQNPGVSAAHGSMTVTTSAANASTRVALVWRSASTAAVTAASISSVRCVGTE